mgnify:FL=1
MPENLSILHITNSYGGTTVYQDLYTEIDKLGIHQQIFVPLNFSNQNRLGNQIIDFKTENSKIFYSTTLKKFHKYFFKLKIINITKSLKKKIKNIEGINLIHASTFCLDGAVAYQLWKKYKVPYIVTVRNTDINTYYKKLFWRRPFFHSILRNSEKILFISPSYQNRFLNGIVPNAISKTVKDKVITIPNGVDANFIISRSKKVKINTPVSVLYVGGIQENKNIHSTIEAIKKCNSKGINITYTIIGKGLENRRYSSSYIQEIEKYEELHDWLSILPKQDKKTLKISYANSDIFVMPSMKETFGLVYVEALSQGLPIIYSKGQGIDGFFQDGEVGYAVNPRSIDDIAEKIEMIINNYQELIHRIQNIDMNIFSWESIAIQYQMIYKSILVKE